MATSAYLGCRFRVRTGWEPSGKTSIMGQSYCTAEELTAFARRRNPGAPDCSGLYLQLGERYGVRGDLAYCQAMYETKMWSLDADYSEERLAKDAEVQIRRLHRFAVGPPPQEEDRPNGELHAAETRLRHLRGQARCWEDLNGKWPGAGDRYGQDIVSIWRNLLEWAGKGGIRVEKKTETALPESQQGERARLRHDDQVPDGNETAQAGTSLEQRVAAIAAQEDLNWLRSRDLLPVPDPSPGKGVTWAELAALLRRWDEKRPEPSEG